MVPVCLCRADTRLDDILAAVRQLSGSDAGPGGGDGSAAVPRADTQWTGSAAGSRGPSTLSSPVGAPKPPSSGRMYVTEWGHLPGDAGADSDACLGRHGYFYRELLVCAWPVCCLLRAV